MKRSITNRFFALYLIMTFAMGTVLAVLIGANQIDLIMNQVISRSTEWGLIIREKVTVAASQSALTETTLAAIAEDVVGFDLISIAVADGFGTILADSGAAGLSADDSELRDIHTAITRKEFQGRLFHFKVDRPARVLTIYIPSELRGQTGVVIARLSLSELSANFRRLTYQTVVVLGIVLAFILGLMFHTWRRIVRPITEMRNAVDNISRGDFDVSLDLKRDDEIGSLTQAIHLMGGSLRDLEEAARSANPLTGLPGNVKIEYQVRQLIDDKSVFCLIYADLDNFKAYNDAYGVSKGDDVILYAAKVLKESVHSFQSGLNFVGHQGGDDFVAICAFEHWEDTCRKIVDRFDRGVPEFYGDTDRERGFMESIDRRGEPRRFPLVSISLAVVTNRHRELKNFAEVAGVAAEMKKLVKGKEGSVYAIDKRTK